MQLNVTNDDLEGFYYPNLGMEERKQVNDNGTVRVQKDVGERLLEHPSGDFEATDGADGGGEA